MVVIIISDYWTILIVDNDNFVHVIIKELLRDFKFEGKPLKILSAKSSVDALHLLSDHKDVSVILLDMFIEEENKGLKIAKYIRETIGDGTTRIILMTGEGSNELEETAILNYDINGYEDKTEILSRKLHTIIVSELRSYRDVTHISNNKKAMKQMAASSSSLLEIDSMEEFMKSTFYYLNTIVNFCKKDEDCEECNVNGLTALRLLDEEKFTTLLACGKYRDNKEGNPKDILSLEDIKLINKAYDKKDYILTENRYVAYYGSSSGIEGVIFIEIKKQIKHVDIELLDVFNKNIFATFESLCLNKEIEETQREILYVLGEVTEARSEETGNHVKRVSKYCQILGQEYGLTNRELKLLTLASPIHDIGKVAIPDNILLKPGELTQEEFDIIKTHTTIGHNLLKSSNRELLQAAAIIAHQHHERWDGTGYPQGLKGEVIHIYGRIVSIADVFDALGSDRIYKKAWVIEDVLNHFKKERGKQFDPDLVDILFDNLDKFLEIKNKYFDKTTKVI